MAPLFDPEKVILKVAAPGELTALLKFIRSYYRFDRIQFNRREILSGLKLLLNDETLGRAWLIRYRDKAIGYVIGTFGFELEFGGRQVTVTDLYVQTRYRGKGVGRNALMNIEEFCRARSIKAIELQVTSKNTRALGFYECLGFGAHERIPMSKGIASQPPRQRIRPRTHT